MRKPDNFTGIVYKLEDPKYTVLLFSNGSFVVVGAKNESVVKKAVERVKRDLKRAGILKS